MNYKVFIPVGITFLGAGVVFVASVSGGVGAGLIGVGIMFIVIGVKNRQSS